MSDTHGHYITIPGLYVNGDLSAKQYHGVKFSAATADVVIALTATTDVALGVLMDAPDAAGEAATVAAMGIVTVVAGTSVLARGQRWAFNSTGKARLAGAQSRGVMLETAAAIGDELRALLDMGKGG